MENKEVLKKMGLDNMQSDIYIALLRLGGAKASDIAKEVGMKRTTAYPVLKKMATQGFARVYFRNNTRFYYAQKPKQVAAHFSQKLDSFWGIVPLLESLEHKESQEVGLRFIETVDELKEFHIGILDEYKNKSYSSIGSTRDWLALDPEFFSFFLKQRADNNITTRLLITADSQDINPTDTNLLRSYKYLPEKYAFKSTIELFEDKILVISPELHSVAVVISIPAMVDIFESMFEFMWDMCPNEE